MKNRLSSQFNLKIGSLLTKALSSSLSSSLKLSLMLYLKLSFKLSFMHFLWYKPHLRTLKNSETDIEPHLDNFGMDTQTDRLSPRAPVGAKNCSRSQLVSRGMGPRSRLRDHGLRGSHRRWKKGHFLIAWFLCYLYQQNKSYFQLTNKLKCQKNPHWVLTWQKPPHFGTFWRNFNSL